MEIENRDQAIAYCLFLISQREKARADCLSIDSELLVLADQWNLDLEWHKKEPASK